MAYTHKITVKIILPNGTEVTRTYHATGSPVETEKEKKFTGIRVGMTPPETTDGAITIQKAAELDEKIESGTF